MSLNTKNTNQCTRFIIPWVLSKKNSLQYDLDRWIMFSEWNFHSNDISVEKLAIDKFYTITQHENSYLYKELEGKSSFYKEKFKLLQNYHFENFHKNFDDKKNSANYARLIYIQRFFGDQENIHESVKSSRYSRDIREMTLETYDDSKVDIIDWIDEISRKYVFLKQALFIPVKVSSIFSEDDFFYEIKYSKYLARRIKNKVKMNGYTDEGNATVFKELYSSEYSSNYDPSVAYFDPIEHILKKNDKQFFKNILNKLDLDDQFYKKILKKKKFELNDSEKLALLNDLLEVINRKYFQVIVSQQKYVMKRIILNVSKSRQRMSLKDILVNMLQRIDGNKVEGLYFLNQYCQRDDIVSFLDIIEDTASMDFNVLYHTLILYTNMSVIEKSDFLRMESILKMLEMLFEKKSLMTYLDETLEELESVLKTHELDMTHTTRKIKSFLSYFLSDLFEVSKEKGDRKYLNQLYMDDLRSILDKNDKVFPTLFLDYFDFLSVDKLLGKIDETTESSIFKKILYRI